MPASDPNQPTDSGPGAALSVRAEQWPDGLSLIVAGPLGSVELQIRPSLLLFPGGGMSLEYHSRQPMPGADRPMNHCLVLHGTCYGDGTSRVQPDFEALFRAGDTEAILADLADRYRNRNWTYTAHDDSQAPMPEPAPGTQGRSWA